MGGTQCRRTQCRRGRQAHGPAEHRGSATTAGTGKAPQCAGPLLHQCRLPASPAPEKLFCRASCRGAQAEEPCGVLGCSLFCCTLRGCLCCAFPAPCCCCCCPYSPCCGTSAPPAPLAARTLARCTSSHPISEKEERGGTPRCRPASFSRSASHPACACTTSGSCPTRESNLCNRAQGSACR